MEISAAACVSGPGKLHPVIKKSLLRKAGSAGRKSDLRKRSDKPPEHQTFFSPPTKSTDDENQHHNGDDDRKDHADDFP